MKKIISILLIAALLTCSCFAAGSSHELTTEEMSGQTLPESLLSQIVLAVEQRAFIAERGIISDENFVDLDIASLEVGEEIFVYEYTETGYQPITFSYLPILANGEIIGLAVKTESSDGTVIINGIHTRMLDALNDFRTSSNCISLIHYEDGCYAYNGSEIALVLEYGYDETSRLPLSDAAYSSLSTASVQMSSTTAAAASLLDACTARPADTRTVDYQNLQVEYVSQNGPNQNNLCWAASVCMIGRYCTGDYTYDIVDIAKYEYGADYNQGAETRRALEILKELYPFNTEENPPYGIRSDGTEFTVAELRIELLKDKPVYGDFKAQRPNAKDIKHAAVIHGYLDVDGIYTVYITDPTDGFVTASFNGRILTYSSESGWTLTLEQYGCSDIDQLGF